MLQPANATTRFILHFAVGTLHFIHAMSSPIGSGKLSVCMIVRNEERNLPGALDCTKRFADEIIVVDTGSTDRTRDIIQSSGARLFEFPWCDNFSAARNESLRHAVHDWILWIDADDRIDEEDGNLISRLKRVSPREVVYCFQVISVSDKGNHPPFMQMRMFPRRPELLFENRVHESIGRNAMKQGLRVDYTSLKIFHRGYHSDASVQEKLRRNLKLIELDLAENPQNTAHLYQLGQTYAALGMPNESIREFKRIMDIPKQKQIQRFVYEHTPAEIASKYFDLGDLDQCLRWVETGLGMNSDNIVALYLKAEVMARKNQPDVAKALFHKVAYGACAPNSLPIDIPGYKKRAVLRIKELESGMAAGTQSA